MNEDVVYGLLTAILLLCYIIAVRVKHMKHDVECMHDFTHALGEHPLVSGLLAIDSEMALEEISRELRKQVRKNGSEDVPAPFKEWDES